MSFYLVFLYCLLVSLKLAAWLVQLQPNLMRYPESTASFVAMLLPPQVAITKIPEPLAHYRYAMPILHEGGRP